MHITKILVNNRGKHEFNSFIGERVAHIAIISIVLSLSDYLQTPSSLVMPIAGFSS